MLRVVEIVTSIISSIFYLALISYTNQIWKKIKANSYYLLPLMLSFFVLFVHKFIVITNAIGSWRVENKVTLAHSLVFAILFQSIFFVDKYYEDRQEKMKALMIITGILLTGYVLGLEGIALTVAIVEIFFVVISVEPLLSYAFGIYFLVDALYIVDVVLDGGFIMYAYIAESFGTLLFYIGFKKAIAKSITD